MKRFWKRLGLTIAVLAGLLGITAWVTLTWLITRPTGYQPEIDAGPIVLRDWAEHDAIYQRTKFPYVLALAGEKGSLEYIGAKHTSDATDSQLDEIERRWGEFYPTIALCEGRSRMYRFSSRPKTGHLSESELVRILANQNRIPLYTLEPEYEAEVEGLLEKFEARLVATYVTLRVYSSEARNAQGDRDRLALSLMRKRTNVKGLRNTFSNLDELDAYWAEKFSDQPDWRTLSDTEQTSLLVEVGNVSRQVRGEHMVRTIVELVGKGERVLAVVGASHVIRQEPALRSLIEPGQSKNKQSDKKTGK